LFGEWVSIIRRFLGRYHENTVEVVRCRPWRHVVHGAMPSVAQCRPWRNAVRGAMPSVAQCRPWRNAVRGAMPSVAQCRPWRNAVRGAMPSVAQCRPWRNAVGAKQARTRVVVLRRSLIALASPLPRCRTTTGHGPPTTLPIAVAVPRRVMAHPRRCPSPLPYHGRPWFVHGIDRHNISSAFSAFSAFCQSRNPGGVYPSATRIARSTPRSSRLTATPPTPNRPPSRSACATRVATCSTKRW
jgi:hypothetical protein